MGRQKHEAGALLFGLPDRLSRLYSVLFGELILGQDDAVAGPWVAADGHRDLPQSGLVQQLHRGVKAVQITVQYDALSHAFHLPAQQISLAVYDTMSVPFLYVLYTFYVLLMRLFMHLLCAVGSGSLSLPSSPPFSGQKTKARTVVFMCAPCTGGAHRWLFNSRSDGPPDAGASHPDRSAPGPHRKAARFGHGCSPGSSDRRCGG